MPAQPILPRKVKMDTVAGNPSAASAAQGGAFSDVPSVDLEVLAELREGQEEGEEDFGTEMIDLFLQDVPPRLASICEAVERGDAQALMRAAHAMKGSCGNLGVRRLGKICERLEHLGRGGTVEGASELLPLARLELAQASDVLRAQRR
jgi:HPt (histidine-containing phosphotransfer) domain-containing protein